jgi:hypothetical protein
MPWTRTMTLRPKRKHKGRDVDGAAKGRARRGVGLASETQMRRSSGHGPAQQARNPRRAQTQRLGLKRAG